MLCRCALQWQPQRVGSVGLVAMRTAGPPHIAASTAILQFFLIPAAGGPAPLHGNVADTIQPRRGPPVPHPFATRIFSWCCSLDALGGHCAVCATSGTLAIRALSLALVRVARNVRVADMSMTCQSAIANP